MKAELISAPSVRATSATVSLAAGAVGAVGAGLLPPQAASVNTAAAKAKRKILFMCHQTWPTPVFGSTGNTAQVPAIADNEGNDMPNSVPARQRLDSWKAIAAYLRRDLATVRRWETDLGLPVYRVGGTGRSVFAYAHEIDEWLVTPRPQACPP